MYTVVCHTEQAAEFHIVIQHQTCNWYVLKKNVSFCREKSQGNAVGNCWNDQVFFFFFTQGWDLDSVPNSVAVKLPLHALISVPIAER